MKRFVGILCGVFMLSAAELRPFPQSLSYPDALKPSAAQSVLNEDIARYYSYWKETYLRPSQNTPEGWYILTDGGTGVSQGCISVSEGHGFAMVILALMAGDSADGGDPEGKTLFDGFYTFFRAHPSSAEAQFMAWEIISDGNGGEKTTDNVGSATDGDMDIAYALLLADRQWGSSGSINYLAEAKKMITALKRSAWNTETGRPTLGDWVDPNDPEYYWATRSSDFMTDHMAAYGEASGDAFWTASRDSLYALLDNFQQTYAPNTGLIADFIDGAEGAPAAQNYLDEFPETDSYFQNACRDPWRIALDFALYESSDAKQVLNRISRWIRTKTGNDPAKIAFGYTLAGLPIQADTLSMSFAAPLIAAQIADTAGQDYLDTGWNCMKNARESYYPDCINLQSMLLIAGNAWSPAASLPVNVTRTVQQRSVSGQLSMQTKGAMVHLEGLKGNEALIEMHDLRGALVLSWKTQGSASFSGDMSTVAAGCYSLRVSSAGLPLFSGTVIR